MAVNVNRLLYMPFAEQQNGIVMAEGANWTKPLPLLGIMSYLDAHTSSANTGNTGGAVCVC